MTIVSTKLSLYIKRDRRTDPTDQLVSFWRGLRFLVAYTLKKDAALKNCLHVMNLFELERQEAC